MPAMSIDVCAAEVVNGITPGVGDPADPGDECDHAANFRLLVQHSPGAYRERADNLQRSAQLHQEIHRQFKLEAAHVEAKNLSVCAFNGRSRLKIADFC